MTSEEKMSRPSSEASSEYDLNEAVELARKKKQKPLPPIPTLPKEIYNLFAGHSNSEYPPLLVTHSWTKARPFKVIHSNVKSSEFIKTL